MQLRLHLNPALGEYVLLLGGSEFLEFKSVGIQHPLHGVAEQKRILGGWGR